jgi:hypothetical protein
MTCPGRLARLAGAPFRSVVGSAGSALPTADDSRARRRSSRRRSSSRAMLAVASAAGVPSAA